MGPAQLQSFIEAQASTARGSSQLRVSLLSKRRASSASPRTRQRGRGVRVALAADVHRSTRCPTAFGTCGAKIVIPTFCKSTLFWR